MVIRWVLVLALATSCATSGHRLSSNRSSTTGYQSIGSGGCAAGALEDLDLTPLDDAYGIDDVAEPPRNRVQVDIAADEWSGPPGQVVLEVVILKSGRVHPTRVLYSVNDCVAAVAIQTVRKWLYHPARVDGQTVAVVTDISFHRLF